MSLIDRPLVKRTETGWTVVSGYRRLEVEMEVSHRAAVLDMTTQAALVVVEKGGLWIIEGQPENIVLR
jgi:hypothetical protein